MAGASASYTSCLPGKGCSTLPLHTFLSSPHSLLFSGNFYFVTSIPSSSTRELFNFGLFPASLTLSPIGSSSPEPSLSPFLASPALGPSLQGSSASTSSVPFRDAHPLGLSLPGLTPSPSCPFQDSLFPRVPPFPCGHTSRRLQSLLGLSPPGPSCPFLPCSTGTLLCPPGRSPPASVSSPVLSSHPSSLGAWLFHTPAPAAPPV